MDAATNNKSKTYKFAKWFNLERKSTTENRAIADKFINN